jgi:hypothetical protein
MDPQIVQSFDVPVFIVHKENFQIEDWDLTTQRVYNYTVFHLDCNNLPYF